MEFPARVTLASGAIVLLQNTSQMEALPLGVAFQSDGADGMDGTHLYREAQASMAGEAKRLRVELQAAVDALALAERCMKEGIIGPMKVQHVHQAAERAKVALEDTVHA